LINQKTLLNIVKNIPTVIIFNISILFSNVAHFFRLFDGIFRHYNLLFFHLFILARSLL